VTPSVTGIPNIGDPTLVDAICDRLLHKAYKIELKGDSMRKNQGGPTIIRVPANQETEERELQMTIT